MPEKTDQRLSWGAIIISGLLLAACASHPQPPLSLSLGKGEDRSVLQAQARPASAIPALPTAYGKLPLAFEVNQGQSDPSVQFLARGRGYALLLTPTEAILSLRKGEEERQKSKGKSQKLALSVVEGAKGKSPDTAELGTQDAGRTTHYANRSAPTRQRQPAPAHGRTRGPARQGQLLPGQ